MPSRSTHAIGVPADCEDAIIATPRLRTNPARRRLKDAETANTATSTAVTDAVADKTGLSRCAAPIAIAKSAHNTPATKPGVARNNRVKASTKIPASTRTMNCH